MASLDHLFVFLFAFAYPIMGWFSFRRLLRRLDAGEPANRSQLYTHSSVGHWALLLLGVLLWANAARPWSLMGFTIEPDLWFLIGTALTIASIAALVLQFSHFKKANHTTLQKLRAQFGKLSVLIPRNRSELNHFFALSIAAGIVEEILWRGFLIWYLGQYMPILAAALLSTLAFALAHAYQGASKLPQITLVGAALAGLYLLSGSIWLPVILHAAIDISQGFIGYRLFGGSNDDSQLGEYSEGVRNNTSEPNTS